MTIYRDINLPHSRVDELTNAMESINMIHPNSKKNQVTHIICASISVNY